MTTTFLDKEVNFKVLMGLHEETKERLNEINDRLHYVLGDEIIKFFKKKGYVFVELRDEKRDRKSLIAPTMYDLYLKNTKDLPDIFNKVRPVRVSIFKYYKDVSITYTLKTTPIHGTEYARWVWKKEDFETFYNRRLKKLFV